MNHLKLIQQFLKEKRTLDEMPDTALPFVTISRQAGAGGHLLSYVILTDLLKLQDSELFRGWHVFDKQLCEVVAEDPEIKDSIEELVAERYQSEFREFIESLFTGQSSHYLLYKKTFQVMRMLALLGKVILVGRAGSCVTRDLKHGVHIRLVAPEAQRIVWMMKRFKLTKEEARRAIAKQDSDRRKLLKLFFNRDIDDPLLYDAVWNTGTVDLNHISHSAIELIQSRMTAIKRQNREKGS